MKPHATLQADLDELSFGPFRLPERVDLLYRGDQVVELEPRAVQVLRCLARQAGRVVGKGELLDQVWSGRFVTEGVLKRAVSQVRRALGEGSWIATHHRRGYRFLAEVARAELAMPELAWSVLALPRGPAAPFGNDSPRRRTLETLARCMLLLAQPEPGRD